MARLTALLLGAFGIGCTAVVVAAQADLSSLNWPLLALPVAALAAVLAPSVGVRRVAATGMCVWCCLAAASVGIFLAPCAAAMIVAARSPS